MEEQPSASIGHIDRLKNIEDDDENFIDADKMVQKLMEDNKAYAARMRAAHKICEDANDVGTASFLEIFIDQTERRTWFLFETVSSHSYKK